MSAPPDKSPLGRMILRTIADHGRLVERADTPRKVQSRRAAALEQKGLIESGLFGCWLTVAGREKLATLEAL